MCGVARIADLRLTESAGRSSGTRTVTMRWEDAPTIRQHRGPARRRRRRRRRLQPADGRRRARHRRHHHPGHHRLCDRHRSARAHRRRRERDHRHGGGSNTASPAQRRRRPAATASPGTASRRQPRQAAPDRPDGRFRRRRPGRDRGRLEPRFCRPRRTSQYIKPTPRALQRRHPFGLRAGAIGDGAVLLPGGPEGLSRHVLLQRHEAASSAAAATSPMPM